jgi:hypothetical protein
VDLQTQAGVKGFFARTADPKIAFPGFAHFDHSLFHGPGSNHDAKDSLA